MAAEERTMTKAERRQARKAARAAGERLADDLALAHEERARRGCEFTETARGYRARDRWARRYDELNGAPESDGDR